MLVKCTRWNLLMSSFFNRGLFLKCFLPNSLNKNGREQADKFVGLVPSELTSLSAWCWFSVWLEAVTSNVGRSKFWSHWKSDQADKFVGLAHVCFCLKNWANIVFTPNFAKLYHNIFKKEKRIFRQITENSDHNIALSVSFFSALAHKRKG
jgi:hypothetical protein